MFYIHKDEYPNDYWWKGFSYVADVLGLENKLIDLHTWSDFQEVDDDDFLLARFGHVKEDKEVIKKRFEKIYSAWNSNRVFPPTLAYKLYDNKWKEYKFLRDNNLPTLKTSFVRNKKELSKFLSKEGIDFPVVLKKPSGAGSNYVWKYSSLSDIKNEIFPVLAQDYINSNFDIRLFYLNNKFFAKKRIHSEEGSFPYGRLGVAKSDKIEDLTSVFELSFLKKLWNVFYKKNDIPCMCFDLLEMTGESVIVEFSYCFNYKITLDCSHYYEIDNSKLTRYYKNGGYDNFEKIKHLVPYEIIKWVTNDNLDIE